MADAKWGGNPDGFNNVVWVDSINAAGTWESATGAPDNVLAVTRLRYNAVTGEVVDADMALNRQRFVYEIMAGPVEEDAGSVVDPPGPQPKDLESTVMHEAGHVFGLADIYNPGYPQYVPDMLTGNQNVTM